MIIKKIFAISRTRFHPIQAKSIVSFTRYDMIRLVFSFVVRIFYLGSNQVFLILTLDFIVFIKVSFSFESQSDLWNLVHTSIKQPFVSIFNYPTYIELFNHSKVYNHVLMTKQYWHIQLIFQFFNFLFTQWYHLSFSINFNVLIKFD